jgi:RNA polymerase sigma-70 factor, ECF subfamily
VYGIYLVPSSACDACKPGSRKFVHSDGSQIMATVLTPALRSPVIERVTEISSERFDELMRQHQHRVYRMIFLLARDCDVADTLTQECFLRAYQKRSSFRGECRIETWLLRIALNLVRDHVKNRRVSFWKRLTGLHDVQGEAFESRHLTAPDPSPEKVLLAREQLQLVWKSLSGLSEQQRTIFFLRFAEEMPLADIAETLDLRVGTVKAQLARATSKLRKWKEKQWK